MRKILPFLFASLLLFNSCKKEKDPILPDPDEEVVKTELSDERFVVGLEIEGVKKIEFAPAANAYLVTLPDVFTAESIRFRFKLYPGASFVQGTATTENPEHLDLMYRGLPPLSFAVSNRLNETKQYKIYVKHEGKLEAGINPDTALECDPDGNVFLPLSKFQGIGTIPSRPNVKDSLQAQLKDETGKQISGYVWNGQLVFNNTLPLVGRNVSMLLNYGSQSIPLAEKMPFRKAETVIDWVGNSSFYAPILKRQSFLISGRGFAPKSRYSITLENDFIPQPIVVNATYVDKGQLSIDLPANTPNGTYKISVFQNDALVSSKVTTFAENQTDLSIAQIWTTRTDYPTTLPSFFKANRVVVARGQSLFMNPLPGIMRMGFLGEAPKAFPSLLLVKPGKKTEIKAIMKSDISYGDGMYPLYFGEYQIAQHVEPGIYEARLLYANLAESLPFWSKIEIK